MIGHQFTKVSHGLRISFSTCSCGHHIAALGGPISKRIETLRALKAKHLIQSHRDSVLSYIAK